MTKLVSYMAFPDRLRSSSLFSEAALPAQKVLYFMDPSCREKGGFLDLRK